MVMGAANRLSGAPNMILNGGTFSTGETTGYTQTAGTLTLSSNSTIALGDANGHQLNFADSTGIGWTGTLTIKDWKGVAGVSGTAGQIIFANGTLDAGQLSKIQFEGYALGSVTFVGNELVPTGAYIAAADIGHTCAPVVPEPSTWWGGSFLLSFALWHCWRRREKEKIRGP